MKIFRIFPDSNSFGNLSLLDSSSWAIFQNFDGRKIIEDWTPLTVEFIDEARKGGPLPFGDFPSLASHVPVLSEHAVDVLGKLISDGGELLPLQCNEGKYFAFNVTRVLDALDEQESEIKRFSSGGNVMSIAQYRLFPNKLSNFEIFKLRQIPLMDVFVNEKFKNTAENANLKGLNFELIWSNK